MIKSTGIQKENEEQCKREGHAWADFGPCQCCGEEREMDGSELSGEADNEIARENTRSALERIW